MKTLQVKPICEQINDAAQVAEALDRNGIAWNNIDSCNWPEAYPYAPQAQFRIAHTDSAFLIHYKATEDSVKAAYANDNGSVWTDSCMEFFLCPDFDNKVYYNLECNCIGTVLLGVRGNGVDKAHAAPEIMQTIKRWSSLGRETFAEKIGTQTWEVALIVPFDAYWHHGAAAIKSASLRANFYKCGDELQKPHFLSWAPIEWEKPNFHLPEFFGKIELS